MIFKNKSAYDFMLVGLGNPGAAYENTRHNVGFAAAKLFAEKHGAVFNKRKFEAEYGECRVADKRVLVFKPQTFMNNSGRAVSAAAAFFKIPSDRIIVMSDDISLDVGKIRIRRKGSHGGHNGLRDIIELMGTDEIMRIKIGVGAKPHPDYDLADWVLGRFPSEQRTAVEAALDITVKAAEEIMRNGIDSAMNRYNVCSRG